MPKSKTPDAVRISERVFVMRSDHLNDFASAWARGREAAVPLQDVGSVNDLNPNDPRDTGYAGALPNSYGRVPIAKLFRVYKEDGTFARVVDQIAEDTWGEGWKLATKNEAWAKAAYAIDEALNIRGQLETTDKWHLIGGTALLYLSLQDATAQPWQQPKAVKDVFHVRPVPRNRIIEAKVGDDPAQERFDQVRAYVFTKRGGGQVTVHWQRVLEFRQYPDPDSDWEGISIGRRIHDDVRMKRNVEWAAVTAYAQRSAPLLVVSIKDGAKVGQPEIDEMDEELDLLQSHAIQKVIAKNFKVEAITGTAQLPDPMNWWLMAIRSLAVTTGIPAHIIAGMATGELASSQEDTRRWHSRISRREENFATPILLTWYARLAEWGLLPPVPEDLEIQWESLGEPTAKEAMEIEELRARTVSQYRNAQVQPPAHIVDYPPAEAPASAAAPLPRPTPFGPAPVAGESREADDTMLAPQDRLTVKRVAHVEAQVRERVHAAFMAFWEKWSPTLQGYVAAATETEADGKPTVSLTADFSKAIRDAVLQAYQDAVKLGAQDAAVHIKADQAVQDAALRAVMEKRGVSYFRTVSRLVSGDTAERVTKQIRQVVADGLRAKQDFSVIRDQVASTWRDLAGYEADRIARTESMTAYNAGAIAGMDALGVQEFEFVAYPGSDYGDPAGPCVTRNGERFPVDSEDDTPPLHPNCRCTIVPILPEVA